MRTQNIVKLINSSDIAKKYGIRRLAFFGSFNTPKFQKDSDIDILVEFMQPVGFVKFIKLENELSCLFKRKVDLVTKASLSKFFRSEVLKKAKVVYDQKE